MEITHLRLEGGEHFSVLLDRDGVPAELPLQYGLYLRDRVGAYRIRRAVRRLAEWYFAFTLVGIDPDQLLRTGEFAPDDLESALRALERFENLETSTWMWNARVTEWGKFACWATIRRRWATGAEYVSARRSQADDTLKKQHLKEEWKDLLRPIVIGKKRLCRGFPSREMDAIMSVFERNEDGEYVRSPFTTATTHRNHVILLFIRWGGIRRGGLLSVKEIDLPQRETDFQRRFRVEVEEEPLTFRLERRHDDQLDERGEEPKVKRKSRDVDMPEAAWDVIWELVDSLPENDDGYLIRSSQDNRPLSVRQTGNVVKKILASAAEIYEERWPDEDHTLSEGNAHRFRHHRAIELLPRFFPEGPETVSGREKYTKFFGWANMRSADPYVRLLHLRESERINQEFLLDGDDFA